MMADATAITVPCLLRDLIASCRQHPAQPYHEVVEAALLHWVAAGGWGCPSCAAQVAERVRA
jgi:hypothetical protein